MNFTAALNDAIDQLTAGGKHPKLKVIVWRTFRLLIEGRMKRSEKDQGETNEGKQKWRLRESND